MLFASRTTQTALIPISRTLQPGDKLKFLTIDDVKLGTLVEDPNDPTIDNFVPSDHLMTDIKTSELPSRAITDGEFRIKGKDVEGWIGSIFGFKKRASQSVRVVVTAKRVQDKRIYHESEALQKMLTADKPVAAEETSLHSWIKKAYGETRAIYLVVGVRVVEEANVEVWGITSTEASANAALPVTEAVAAATAVPLPNVNPSLRGRKGFKEEKIWEQELPGPCIYLVSYRKIQFTSYTREEFDGPDFQKIKLSRDVWLPSITRSCQKLKPSDVKAFTLEIVDEWTEAEDGEGLWVAEMDEAGGEGSSSG
jgi:hypothetical protein